MLKLLLLVLAIIATACTLHAYIGLVVISTIVETHTAENVSQLLLWIRWNLIVGGGGVGQALRSMCMRKVHGDL